jgi:hypothetical protein
VKLRTGQLVASHKALVALGSAGESPWDVLEVHAAPQREPEGGLLNLDALAGLGLVRDEENPEPPAGVSVYRTGDGELLAAYTAPGGTHTAILALAELGVYLQLRELTSDKHRQWSEETGDWE